MGTNVGSINLGLNIDPTAFTKGISSAKTSVKNFFSSVSKDSETAVKTIGISFESARSQVGKLAAEYKKQGMSASEAMAKAWKDVDYHSNNGSKSVKKGLKIIKNESKSTAEAMTSNFSTAFKKIAVLAVSAFSLKKVIDFSKSCLSLGSDLAEVQNVVDVTFKSMSSGINSFAQTAITQFGLSETAAKKYAGTFGAMSKAMGLSESAAYEMSTAVTGLTGDVASFFNLSADEAYTKLKSIWTGETETLKDLGVVMTQTALDNYALNNGFGKTTKNMTEQEKLMLRYRYVMSSLSDAQGDFARTQDSWANQTRVLSLRFESLKATLGQGFINVFTPILKGLNMLLGKLQTVANAFKSFTNGLMNKDGIESALSGGTTEAASLGAGIADAGDEAVTAAKKAKKALAGFDEINTLSFGDSEDSAASDVGAGSGSIDLSGINEANSAVDSMAENMGKKFRDIFSKMKTALDPVLNSLSRLKEALNPLKDFSFGAIESFYQKVLKPIGKWTLGKGIPGFIDCLTELVESIDYDSISGALDDLWDSITPFALNVGEGLLWFFQNVLTPLGTWTANELLPAFLGILAGVFDVLNTAIEALKPMGEWLFDNLLRPIAEWTGGIIIDVLTGISDGLTKLSDWISEHQTLVEDFVIIIGVMGFAFAIAPKIIAVVNAVKAFSAAGGIATAVQNAWNASMLANPITWVVAGIAALIAIIILCVKHWEDIKEVGAAAWEHIKNAWNAAGDFFGGLWSGIKDMALTVFRTIGDTVGKMVGNIVDTFGGIITALKGIVQFVSGVFSGDWGKAWEGIKNIFKGVWDALVSIIKTPINAVIGLINGMLSAIVGAVNAVIRALNTISFDIPDWVPGIGGMHFGFDFGELTPPQIPYLAKGGLAYQPTLAMVGDNKNARTDPEVISPLSKLQGIISQSGGNGNDRIYELLMKIYELLRQLDLVAQFNIDGRMLEEVIIQLMNKNSFITNGR